MENYEDFKEVIKKYDINVANFCNTSGINIVDIKEAEISGVLPSYLEMSLMRYIKYLEEGSIFSRAVKAGLKIRNGKIIINVFDDKPKKLDAFNISEDEKQFVLFTDER